MGDTPHSLEESPVVWTSESAPRSRLFDDVYFSGAGGLAESRMVYLDGCGLPAAWAGRRCFVVGELGFGSGLNVVALLDLWRRFRPDGGRLQIFSVEAFPMPAADAARALAAWPEVGETAEALIQRWPGRATGFHRLEFAQWDAVLDLAVMDVAEALDAWTGAADAWFLDGFSPARNPRMWSEAVLAGIARRSAPGARVATFSVAGVVRRGLEAQGFAVERRPGFGAKRQRLEAHRPARIDANPAAGPPRIAIVGAGVAGATLARAFAALGARSLVIEAAHPGAGASGNPAALVMPRLDAGGGSIAQLYAQAFARAIDLYRAIPGAVISTGARQLETGIKDPGRFDRIASSPLFDAGAVERTPDGLYFPGALVVEPDGVLESWLAGAEVKAARVAALTPGEGCWRLEDAAGRVIAEAEIVCLACGLAATQLAPDLALAPVRGQVSWTTCDDAPGAVIGGGYLIATRDGLLFGATHDRDDAGSAVSLADHHRNIDLLRQVRPDLAANVDPWTLGGRAGVRAVTPDFLPLAGALAGRAGLFVLSGLGSRGFCAAPLLAEHVAAWALGAPSPLPATLATIVDPARFAARQARRRPRVRAEAD
jgi:tRNA 5-methylaminomethyl-2-thiouridine biosynthesis bifunctional protein